MSIPQAESAVVTSAVRRRRALIPALAGAAVALGLGGILANDFVPARDAAVVAATYRPAPFFFGGLDTSIHGELVNRQGCLVIESNTGTAIVLAFPQHKVKYRRDGRIWLFRTDYQIGDTVLFGGGPGPATDVSVPRACQEFVDAFGGVFHVFNYPLFLSWCGLFGDSKCTPTR